MNKFPRTFCITLKETPLRTKYFLESAKKAGIDVEFFHGVFGSRLKLTPRQPNELECPGQNIFMTDGAVGCYLSHFILWNILLYLPDEEFLILEDDAVFIDGFKDKFQLLYSRLPTNWGMVYVGWLPYGDNVKQLVVDEGISIRQPSATHGYLIKKSILKMACDAIQPCSSPIDLTILSKLLPCIEYYLFDPPLITQRSFENRTDPIWNSLVYDWKTDVYGNKKTMLKSFSLSSGWHDVEHSDTEQWRWSKDAFNITIPLNIVSITLICSTPIKNVLNVFQGETPLSFELNIGDNTINIPSNGYTKLDCQVQIPFIPVSCDENSKDERQLGICLKKTILHTGTFDLEINLTDLSPAPMSFKL